MSLKSSGNNVFAVEDTNDITGIYNHKHIIKSRVSQYMTYGS